MSSINKKIWSAMLGSLVLFLLSACEEPVTKQGFHKHAAPMKKGNATIQLDAKLTAGGDVIVSVISLSDLSFVDIKTKVGEEWRELARLQDLKAGEAQTLTLQGPFDSAQYLWATGSGAEAKWVAQSRILASEDAPVTASKTMGFSAQSLQEEEQTQKLKAGFTGKKIME